MTTFARYSLISALTRLIAAAWRGVSNRKQIAKLQDLTDAQLQDIGLTRGDVRQALRTPLFTDPSPVLTAWARERGYRNSSFAPDLVPPVREQAAKMPESAPATQLAA